MLHNLEKIGRYFCKKCVENVSYPSSYTNTKG